MLTNFKQQALSWYHKLSDSMARASSTCGALNAHQYVDLCHSVNVDFNHWHHESGSELANLQTHTKH